MHAVSPPNTSVRPAAMVNLSAAGQISGSVGDKSSVQSADNCLTE
jgi:hypothetical protein